VRKEEGVRSEEGVRKEGKKGKTTKKKESSPSLFILLLPACILFFPVCFTPS